VSALHFPEPITEIISAPHFVPRPDRVQVYFDIVEIAFVPVVAESNQALLAIIQDLQNRDVEMEQAAESDSPNEWGVDRQRLFTELRTGIIGASMG
jgi:hypothetical protein